MKKINVEYIYMCILDSTVVKLAAFQGSNMDAFTLSSFLCLYTFERLKYPVIEDHESLLNQMIHLLLIQCFFLMLFVHYRHLSFYSASLVVLLSFFKIYAGILQSSWAFSVADLTSVFHFHLPFPYFLFSLHEYTSNCRYRSFYKWCFISARVFTRFLNKVDTPPFLLSHAGSEQTHI